ncbi:MAG: methionine adenosyltransferase [Coriobacteriia bacterium]|nr:methionine adenosyltransferase [Coriobacteriia bacterium]MCL2870744.1 methionine adenosyltransferase [Coriobacteriia bacterium]
MSATTNIPLDSTNSFLFTSESVTEGHPDKICDQISDALLDELIRVEAKLEAEGRGDLSSLRSACEAFVTTGLVMVGGEIRTNGYVDVDSIVRGVIADIGYTHSDFGFDAKTCGVINAIHNQSPDIAQGVDQSFEAQRGDTDPLDLIGAGDQGMMFGYACNETTSLMPMPVYLAHRLSERLTAVRKSGEIDYLRPDGKTQVSVRYVDGRPVAVEKILISTQHAEGVDLENQLRTDLIEKVIRPVFESESLVFKDAEIYINPTGRFVIGGPMGDSGLTGRKIIVDTYGGTGRHGGGAFSGKDCTKVDRSGAYAARWVAKNVVAAGLADRAEVQLAYAIGVAKPFSIMVDTFGTEKVDRGLIEKAILEVFDLRPGAIMRDLDLLKPIFRKTAAYGHFGREDQGFTWEQTNRVDELRTAAGLG